MMFLVCPLLCCAALAEEVASAKKIEEVKHYALIIRTQGGETWDASIEDVEKVLHSAAGELWKHFPGRKLDPILVAPKGGPIVLFKRGPEREYYVRLDTGGNLWAQYSYQFAHEMCHILCTYRETQSSANKWFEETLCELASLYALRQMAQTWKTKPPYANWKGYAPRLGEYAQKVIDKSALPKDQTLAQWYVANAEKLRKSATQRDLNNVAAAALLPLFEKEPEHWAAVEYLNAGNLKGDEPLEQHLKNWHDQAPAKHRGFIIKVAAALGIKIQE